MNKMYNDLGKLKFVNYLYSPPSGSDESLSIGACYYLSKTIKTFPLDNIYIGKNLISDEDKVDLKYLRKNSQKNYVVIKNFSHKNLVSLLKKNEIIATVRGREEFARASNRSIIANPSNYDVVQKINESIKNRDFWMPFAHNFGKENIRNLLVIIKIEVSYISHSILK